MRKLIYMICATYLGLIASAYADSGISWKTKKVVVEYYTTVGVGTYTPSISVKPSAQSTASYSTPEKAASSLLSAMAAGDYDWWLSIWSAEAREMMTKRYQEIGRKPSEIVSNWKGILTERPVALIGKAEYVRRGVTYALVRYRMTGVNLTAVDTKTNKVTKLGAKEFENTLSFRQINGRWEAVQDLASDPVFENSAMLWKDGTNEVRLSRPAD